MQKPATEMSYTKTSNRDELCKSQQQRWRERERAREGIRKRESDVVLSLEVVGVYLRVFECVYACL